MKKLLKSIPAYMEAKRAFDELSDYPLVCSKKDEWLKMEKDALRGGGILLEQLYDVQIKRSAGACLFFHYL